MISESELNKLLTKDHPDLRVLLIVLGSGGGKKEGGDRTARRAQGGVEMVVEEEFTAEAIYKQFQEDPFDADEMY